MHSGKTGPNRKQKKEEKSYLWLILLSSSFVLIFFVSLNFSSLSPQSSSTEFSSVADPRDQLNQQISLSMQDTLKKQELKALAVELENHESIKKLPRLGLQTDPSSVKNSNRSYGLDLRQDRSTDEILEDLRPSGDSRQQQYRPEDLINSELANRVWKSEYDRDLQAAYIRQFVENAREAGLAVQLNSDLEVVSITRIEQQDIYRIPQGNRRPPSGVTLPYRQGQPSGTK